MSLAFSIPTCLTWITFLTGQDVWIYLSNAVAWINCSIVISGCLCHDIFCNQSQCVFSWCIQLLLIKAMIFILKSTRPSLKSAMKLIKEEPRFTRLLRNSFAYSYLLKIELAVSPSTLSTWKYSLNWCWEGCLSQCRTGYFYYSASCALVISNWYICNSTLLNADGQE